MLSGTDPILSCAEARTFEAGWFGGDEAREWRAMQAAGRAVAVAVRADLAEVGGPRGEDRLLVLAGKGHNAGDALIAARHLLAGLPGSQVEVRFACGERELRPLAARAWRELLAAGGSRVHLGRRDAGLAPADIALDGVFGFQFRPPLEEATAKLLEAVNALPVRLRAAVDLPSGDGFRADFTYATGSVKAPVLASRMAGRVRYLDLRFFTEGTPGTQRVLTRRVLAPLAGLRPAQVDKRTFGHVLVLGGSRDYPGAVLMTVLAALRSGAGLVSAFVPESLAPAFAARAPEAMWVGWPETPAGSLALEGEALLRARLPRAQALVIGPGLGREAETLALVRSVVAQANLPLVLDADALQPEMVAAGTAARILTPHAGEFARVAGDADLAAYAAAGPRTVVLKGPVTRVAGGGGDTKGEAPVYHSFFGGPVLARGGSGDLLAGLIGGLLAQSPGEPLRAAARGVVWHGLAADHLARAEGSTAISVTRLLDFLPAALAECGHESFVDRAAGPFGTERPAEHRADHPEPPAGGAGR